MEWLLLLRVIVTFVALLGAVGVLLGLPGTFLAWLGVSVVALASHFEFLSGWWLVGTFIGCGAMELADNFLAGLLVRRLGASSSSMVIAWLGGFGGGLLGGVMGGVAGFIGSALLAVIGAFIGSYASVYAWERYRQNRPHKEAMRAAVGTVLGRLLGIGMKLGWIGWLISLIW
ncbi:MAG: hypothetical protein IMHGJWDQ_001021 [Candidatus Fervidibacter sp.]